MTRSMFIAALVLVAPACASQSADVGASDLCVPGDGAASPDEAASPSNVSAEAADAPAGSASQVDAEPDPHGQHASATGGHDFRFMVGEWTVTETLEPGPMGAGGSGTGRMVATLGPAGNSVLVDYRTETGPMKGFAMHEILSWDGEGETFSQTYVTSFEPGAASASGSFVDGAYVTERVVGEQDGTTFVSRGLITDVTQTGFAMESFIGPKGGPMAKVLRLDCVRVQ